MGEARRKRLQLRKLEAKREQKQREIVKIDAYLTETNARVLELRSEFDLISTPWRKHLQDFADRVGPLIFSKDDPEIETFILKRVEHMSRVSDAASGEAAVSLLASILDPFITKQTDLLAEGYEILHSRVEANNLRLLGDDAAMAALPTRHRDVALMLGAIYAERMLEGRTSPELFVPFREIDWSSCVAAAGASNVEYRLAAALGDLTGEAREARIVLGSLSDAERARVQAFVKALPDGVMNDFLDAACDCTAMQQVFDTIQPTLKRYVQSRVPREELETFDPDFVPVVSLLTAKAVMRNLIRQARMYDTEKAFDTLKPAEQREWLDSKRKYLEELAVTARLWSDEQLTHVGMSLWERTYKLGKPDTDVAMAATVVAERWRREHPGSSISRQRLIEDLISFSAKWAVHAFQRITTTHTYAAALMCSDADKAVLQDLEMQWSAFMVCLPNRLLSYVDESGASREYNRILVGTFDRSASLILLNQNGDWSQPNILSSYGTSIAEVLEVRDQDSTGNIDVSMDVQAKINRIVTLARRLVAGLLLALQTRTNFKSTVYPSKPSKKNRETEEPSHRVVFVGAPLKIDCRPSIRDFIEKGSSKRKGAPPQVQTLVRGHFRRQVCGVGRLQRKVIWVFPFWRGSEDAPILTRPKVVKGATQ